jgi:hypothetical protein
MNAHLPNVTISNALREVAMIAEVKTSALGLTRTDKRASARTTEAHHAHSNAARVSVNRMAGADELHRDITSLQEQTRVNLHGYSTAWGSTSRRLLPNANFEPWIREHARIQGEFEAKLVLLRAEAPALVAKATAALGEFDVKPPTVEEIVEAYSIRYALEPIPDGAQFGGLPGAAEEFLRRQFENNIQTAYQEAQLDAMSRLSKPLEALVERIGAYDEREDRISKGEDPGKGGIFRDTLVSNVQDIAAVFDSFNMLSDPTMTKLSQRLQLFLTVSPDDLRKNNDLRASARTQAQTLIDDLNDLMLPMKR